MAALGLLALLVLIVLAWASLVGLDLRTRETIEDRALARAQALFALEHALAELSDALGPDQRISARSELSVQGKDTNRYWTGAWNFTEKTAGSVRWLVSGEETPLSFRPGLHSSSLNNEQAVWMVWKGTVDNPDDYVHVPLIQNPHTHGLKRGRHAFWISDEGMKASIMAGSRIPESISDTAVSLWMQRGISSPRLNTVFPEMNLGQPNSTDIAELLDRGQLPALLGDLERLALRHNFHHFTPLTKGLLTNPAPRDGGALKLPLDHSEGGIGRNRFDDVFASGAALRAWRGYPAPDAEGRFPLVPIEAEMYDHLDTGEPYVLIVPVLAEVMVRLTVYDHWVRKEPAVRFNIEAEFWNPFSRPLVLNAPGSNDKRALSVRMESAPLLTVENHSTGMIAGPVALDNMHGSSGLEGLLSWMEFDSVPGGAYAGKAVLQAGETYRLQDPDPSIQPMGLVRYTGHRLEVENEHEIEARLHPADGSQGRVFFRVHWGREGEGPRLWEMRHIPYQADNYTFYPPLDIDVKPYMTLSTAVRVDDMFTFAFHYGLGIGKSWLREEELAQWRNRYDLRRPYIDFEGNYSSEEGYLVPNRTFVRMASQHPVATENTISEVFPGTDWIFDAYSRDSSSGSYADIRLYDLPEGRPLTIADFRHLPYKGLVPFALGSPSGALLNDAFDRYFMVAPWSENTDLESGDVTASGLLYRPAAGFPPEGAALYGPDSALDFLVPGAFNVHSTSIAAWVSVLSQAFYEPHPWYFFDGETLRSKELPAAVARLNLGAQFGGIELVDNALEAGPIQENRPFYFRQGIREVEPARIKALAVAIVDRLQKRGTPYPSLAAFLNDGVVEAALRQSDFNAGYPRHANGYVTQSDVMAMLAWRINVRSDTFLIRAYGDCVKDATGEVVARAALEALVIRDYDYQHPQVPAASALNHPRRFILHSIRWLDPYTDW